MAARKIPVAKWLLGGGEGRAFSHGRLLTTYVCWQIGTTKGTGCDIIILEEAAYCNSEFFYESVAPLMLISTTCLIAISTLISEINFYTRLMKIRDKHTGAPIFTCLQIQLSCPACTEKQVDCPHMYHLIPRWQSSGKHQRLKAIMQDRPDLIQSELAGLAFDSLQQCFRPCDIELMFNQPVPFHDMHPIIYIFIDPAAGGPGSDYAVLSIVREKGLVTVSQLS